MGILNKKKAAKKVTPAKKAVAKKAPAPEKTAAPPKPAPTGLVDGRCYLRFWTAYPFGIKSKEFEAHPSTATETGATVHPYSWTKRFDSPAEKDVKAFVAKGCGEAGCPKVAFDKLSKSLDERHNAAVYDVLVK